MGTIHSKLILDLTASRTDRTDYGRYQWRSDWRISSCVGVFLGCGYPPQNTGAFSL